MTRHLPALACAALVWAAALACSQSICPIGVLPFDGQTSVPLDTVPVLRASEPFPPDLPWMGTAVRLSRANGRPVEVELEVDPGGTVRVHPVGGLEPDTRYVLEYDPSAFSSRHYLEQLPDWPNVVQFSTGPGLRVLSAVLDDADRVVVVFSEPVDPEAVARSVEVLDHEGALSVASAAAHPDSPRLVILSGDLGDADEVLVRAGLVARSGAELEQDETVEVTWSYHLDRWRGFPYCED